MTLKKVARFALLGWLLLGLVAPPGVLAQLPPPPPPAAPPTFGAEELDQLLAPIALYPDALLAQILMAATYPLEVVEAARWVQAYPTVQGPALEAAMQQQPWDPSVKSLTAFPQVLAMLNAHLDWTQKLGDAFLAQEPDVMATVQLLRAKAQAAGYLQSTPQETVSVTAQIIQIRAGDPAGRLRAHLRPHGGVRAVVVPRLSTLPLVPAGVRGRGRRVRVRARRGGGGGALGGLRLGPPQHPHQCHHLQYLQPDHPHGRDLAVRPEPPQGRPLLRCRRAAAVRAGPPAGRDRPRGLPRSAASASANAGARGRSSRGRRAERIGRTDTPPGIPPADCARRAGAGGRDPECQRARAPEPAAH